MAFKKIFYCFIYFLLCIFNASAQSFNYTQYTTLNGLPIDNVYAATQDDNGFMWFGTDFGISKYDGYKFENYNREDGIATKAITDIVYAGGDSSIFLSYPNTIQSIHGNGRVNTIIPYSNISLEQIVKHQNKFYFYQRNMYLYGVLQHGKVDYYNIKNKLNIEDVILRSITSLKNNGLLFCTNKGLFWEHNNTIKNILPNKDVYFALYKSDNTIIAASSSSLYSSNNNFEFDSKSIKLPSQCFIYNMVEDADNNIWMRSLGKGIYKLNKNELKETSAIFGMQNKELNKFFIDRHANIWFCTSGFGLLFKMSNIFSNYVTTDGLANNKVLALLKSNNNLIIGTANGVSVKSGNIIKPLKLPKANLGLQYVYKLFDYKNSDFGICIVNTFKFDTNSQLKLKKINIDGYNIATLNSLMVYQVNSNTYWSFQGAKLLLIQNNKIINEFDFRQFNVRKLYDIIEYNNKTFLATTDGILVIENNHLKYISTIAKQKLGEVFQFLIDKNNALWMATENGLISYSNDKYNFLEKANSPGANYCKAICLDNDNNIWCATWDGIFVTNGMSKKAFNTNNGLLSKTCHSILYDSATDELSIGSDNGLSIIKRKLLFSKINIDTLFVNCYYGNVLINDNATLKNNQTNLSIYCNIPYFGLAENLVYEYNLDNAKWNTTAEPLINLRNLSGGQHQIIIRAKLNGSVIKEKSFNFFIKNKFYKTWWFWSIILIATQFLIFNIINYYNKKAREKKLLIQKQEVELTTLKQQAFSSLMNPHFIFNALNSIQNFINKQDRLMANKYLSDFAMLVRKSFDAAQEPFVPLIDEIETIRLYLQLEKMRFANKFDYTINLSDDIEQEDWMMPSMVLQPFIENAIIHGIAPLPTHGNLSIEVYTVDNNLIITIQDNGIGIEQSQLLKTNSTHKSKGMYLIKERLQLLSRYSKNPIQLSIMPNNVKKENTGTTIKLIVPQQVIHEFFSQDLKHKKN